MSRNCQASGLLQALTRTIRREQVFGEAALDEDGTSRVAALTQQVFAEVERKLQLSGFWAKRKKLTITVERDRSIVIHAPAVPSDDSVRRAVDSKRQWLFEKLRRPQEYQVPPHPPGKEVVSGESAIVPLADVGAEFLFPLISDRAGKTALILTTNLPFSEWTTVFPNPRLCKSPARPGDGSGPYHRDGNRVPPLPATHETTEKKR